MTFETWMMYLELLVDKDTAKTTNFTGAAGPPPQGLGKQRFSQTTRNPSSENNTYANASYTHPDAGRRTTVISNYLDHSTVNTIAEIAVRTTATTKTEGIEDFN